MCGARVLQLYYTMFTDVCVECSVKCEGTEYKIQRQQTTMYLR